MDRLKARDWLYGFARDRYREASIMVVGAAGAMRYGGLPSDEPSNGTYWSRVTLRVTYQGQEGLRSANGERRFLTEGQLIVQLFCPTNDERGLGAIDEIADMLLNSFRTYQGEEIEFTTAEINDSIPAEPNWIRANVVSTFQYREFL